MSQVSQVAIIGGGIMGGDIATVFAARGWRVHVMSPSQKTRDALPGRMTAGLEKLGADNGADVEFNEVLAIGEGASTTFGSPLVSGAVVTATVLETKKDDKVIIFKKRRRQNSRRKRGHRQDLTVVRVTGISAA